MSPLQFDFLAKHWLESLVMRNATRISTVLAGALLLSRVVIVHAQQVEKADQAAKPPSGPAASAASTAASAGDAARRDKVARAVREKYGIPENFKVSVGACRDSLNPSYYECPITVDDGKHPNTQIISVAKDGRFLGMSSMYPLGADTHSEILRIVREVFHLPPSMPLTAGDLADSAIAGFLSTTVSAGEGEKKQSQQFFLTQDHRFAVLGSVFPLLDSRDIVRNISTKNQPMQGPPDAPVTIVEYADLECPMCAKLHEFFEKDLMPKYPGKVRIVFKEFPLPMHQWSTNAAIANQCAYQIDPANFVAYRSLIFKNQSAINATNSRDMLLNLAAQAGIDSLKLAGCLDSQASRPRVEQSLNEGKKLGTLSTPTCYINGKLLVGLPSVDEYYKAVDRALAAAKTAKHRAS